MIGLVLVRDGLVGAGSQQVSEAATEVWMLGGGVSDAEPVARVTRAIEVGPYAPAAWASFLAGEVGERTVVLSSEPDGRDLAGRLGALLHRRVFAGCLEVAPGRVVVPRYGAATTAVVRPSEPFVATVQARRGASVGGTFPPVETVALDGRLDAPALGTESAPDAGRSLSAAELVVGGGAGLASRDDFGILEAVARALHAASGATRVVTDRGWVPHERQIGTTGVSVSPRTYVAFGISGAVQHTAGLGAPEHVISVNLDPGCPMSLMADLAIVADASATVAHLRDLLEGDQ